MTRINVVPVEELNTKHLVAEYREITRLPKNLETSLNRKGKPFSISEIPPTYTLGTGHVKFFYNKMYFLKTRFEQLVDEMLRRGYNPTYRDSSIFEQCDTAYINDYHPNDVDKEINRQRIQERNNAKTIRNS